MIQYLWAKATKKMRGAAVIGSFIPKSSKIEAGSHIVGSVFGKYSFCGYDCEIVNCEIGSFCSVANHVIIGGAFHPIRWCSTSPVFYEGRDSVKKKFSEFKREEDKKTCIGNDVWIGSNAMVKQGVKIGHGAVIGMGSVVTKDIPPYEIWAGNPARFIRNRFSEEIKKALLQLEWWDLCDQELEEVAEYIQQPIKFIEACKKVRGERTNKVMD